MRITPQGHIQWVGTTSRAPTGGRVLEGVIKLPLARRRREFFGNIDCKSLHLGPEIDATHTLLTADICTDYYHDTLAHNDNSNCLATLSTRSLGCMAGIHSALEPEVKKISLTKSWIVALHRPAEHTRASNEHKLSHHLRGVSRSVVLRRSESHPAIQSISRHSSSPPCQPSGPPRPVQSATQRSRRKRVWRSVTCTVPQKGMKGAPSRTACVRAQSRSRPMSLSFGAVPPVEASYTARRAHAARNERRDENNPAICMQPPPPTSRWRASFSASGNLLTFGSRSVELIDLSKFDRTRDPEDPSPRERMERSLKVHVDHNSRREPLQLHTLLRDYKVAVVGTDQEAPQHALAEQHVWKLVAALFLPVGKDLVPTEGLSLGRDEGKDKSTEATRRLEALRAWLRAAQWDAGAIERCKRDEAIEQDSEAASVWPLLKAADPAEACKAALDDGRAYLGALLAQPTGCVRADLEEQLRTWEGEPPEMVPEPLKRYFGLLAGTVSSWNEGPGKVSSWMHSYTLELLEEQRPPGWPHSYAPAPPAPPAMRTGRPRRRWGQRGICCASRRRAARTLTSRSALCPWAPQPAPKPAAHARTRAARAPRRLCV